MRARIRAAAATVVAVLWATGASADGASSTASAPDGSPLPATGSAASGPLGALLDANTAPRARLESLHGVGPAMAASLLAARAERPFSDWDDLVARVHGVGPATARRLSALGLRVQGRPWPDPAAPE